MFDIGGLELVVIVGIALLVLSPKDIPVAMDVIGKIVATVREMCAHGRHFLDVLRYESEVVRALEARAQEALSQGATLNASTPKMAQQQDTSTPESAAPPEDSALHPTQDASRDLLPPS